MTLDATALLGLVSEIWTEYHFHPDGPPSLIRLYLLKEEWVGLRGAQGGWGISVERASPRSADLGEYGDLRSVRVPKQHPAAHLEGHEIIRVNSLVAPSWATAPVGCVLIDDHGSRLALWNLSDELQVGADWEPALLSRGVFEQT